MIQLVSIAPSVQTAIEAGRGDVAAKSINDFFDLFVRGLTSGDTFALLTAEQQACLEGELVVLLGYFWVPIS